MTTTTSLSPMERDRLDLLISRIADGAASSAEFQAFALLAERDPSAWEQLARAQRDQAALALAVGVHLHAAERVELPTPDEARAALERSVAGRIHTHGRVMPRLTRSAGWAVAALLALAWVGSSGILGNNVFRATSTPHSGAAANLIPSGWTTDDAASAYLDLGKREGRVVSELPQRVLVDMSPAAQGRGYDVIYLRQFVERARVDDLVRFGRDERGGVVPVRISLPGPAGDPQ